MIGPYDHRQQDSRGELGASAVIATGLIASGAPWRKPRPVPRYSCASKRPISALSESVRLLCLSEGGAPDSDI